MVEKFGQMLPPSSGMKCDALCSTKGFGELQGSIAIRAGTELVFVLDLLNFLASPVAVTCAVECFFVRGFSRGPVMPRIWPIGAGARAFFISIKGISKNEFPHWGNGDWGKDILYFNQSNFKTRVPICVQLGFGQGQSIFQSKEFQNTSSHIGAMGIGTRTFFISIKGISKHEFPY